MLASPHADSCHLLSEQRTQRSLLSSFFSLLVADEKELQRSLLMNLAKCSLKLIPRVAGWACYWASLAVAFVQGG